MIDETGGQATGPSEMARKYIDRLADRAKSTVAIASPFLEEIAIVLGWFRDASGGQPSDRPTAPGEGCDLGTGSIGDLGHQVKQHPVASLAIVGVLATACYYITRER